MIPISILLVIFLAFIGLVVLFTFFNVYHILRFGKAGLFTLGITAIYLVVIGALLMWSLYNILTIDWTLTINLFGFEPNITNIYRY
ncbi:hypothetical protein A3B32_02900 [Candidatus Uhrbacteria bacterium RIFCSPLOWO2_01_FULL_53_9]|uniref:Uncharacterized protein n=3 Tax=Candidatus Uhriibacteriota TaxID=1752732 RepID=A0A1F7UYQ7_9BACT|nr:MAG: hypothetical protein A3C17_01010 [Candidatus Uhrbacteria bacterium RIFCSPHIGHO2_02_FULL_53_13]OGL82898.1 MAG: hypothetical protein A3B32_02900 [Candidatus Uhrbacteria bacterium RIFCSPLOWO2_01_FULL_53_9]OGL89654.1 MAG: hypothetical protein A3I45_03705 [Candidatus Uhrbacteria bacterium RIFCSPLOWO2_02_FULL_53_10]